jgi:hypothetical protein
MRKLILIILFLPLLAKSQHVLSGKVLDSLTQQPIPYVNVFFANTTIGTVTNEAGEFVIRNISPGKYDLTASFVGYTTVQLPVNLSDSNQTVILHLAQQVIRLEEVRVQADTSRWRENLEQFKENFLGATENASKTEILNPKSLYLYYDLVERIFVGYGKRDLEIENRALGYKIYYQLVDFHVNYKEGKMAYFGIPRFEAMTAKGNGERRRWEKERRRAYNGSFSHLIQSIRQNALEKNGFEVHELFRVPNRKRPSDAFLSERIKYWRGKMAERGIIIIGGGGKNDSLGYYMEQRALPKLVDSVGRKITDARALFAKASEDVINFKGILQVVYKKEKEEIPYARGRQPLKMQRSVIHFLNDSLKLYENGYYEDIRDVFFEGYMGWSEKLAELLPLEYRPDTP